MSFGLSYEEEIEDEMFNSFSVGNIVIWGCLPLKYKIVKRNPVTMTVVLERITQGYFPSVEVPVSSLDKQPYDIYGNTC